jgi:threonine dehydrogenase-like Zn-dependent dehydrogenase
MPSLLTLSDVMGTGHHAAVSARVRRGGSVAVIGDGAVGLCGVIAAKRLGAEPAQVTLPRLDRPPPLPAQLHDLTQGIVMTASGESCHGC